MIKYCLPSDSPIRDDLEHIIKSADRAKDLVKQILTFSRQVEQERKPVKLQPIFKESLKLLRSSLPSTIEIQQNIGPDCGTVMADSTQMHQVLKGLSYIVKTLRIW